MVIVEMDENGGGEGVWGIKCHLSLQIALKWLKSALKRTL
jgi:hypothetical protein